jgi:sporulation protein YlmC with PRC-barrel domain
VNVVRLSAVMGVEVVTTDGRTLGRVHDLRVRRAGDSYEVEALLVGPRGLLNRLGVPTDADEVPWEAVTTLEADRIVVRYAPPPALK